MTRLIINLGLPTAPRKNEVGAVVTVTVLQARETPKETEYDVYISPNGDVHRKIRKERYGII